MSERRISKEPSDSLICGERIGSTDGRHPRSHTRHHDQDRRDLDEEFAVAAIVWFVLEGTPARVEFEDTDDPAVMVAFIRQRPEVFVQAGTMLVVMAISLAIAVVGVEAAVRRRSRGPGLRSTSAFGPFAVGFFLFGGRIGSSGRLLRMAGLHEAWGEGAYVAAQVASLVLGIVLLRRSFGSTA